MIGTLETKDKQHWKDDHPTLVHAYNCTKHCGMDFSPYYFNVQAKFQAFN